MNKLPEKPSELILVALHDVGLIEANKKKYKNTRTKIKKKRKLLT